MSSSLYVLIHYFIVETFEKKNLNEGADMISISLELVNVWELLLSGSFTKIVTIDFDLKRKRTIQLLFTNVLTRILACKICCDSTTDLTLL